MTFDTEGLALRTSPLLVTGNDQVVEGYLFDNIDDVAVFVEGGSNAVIRYCHFRNVASAAKAHETAGFTLEYCTYENIARRGPGIGNFVQLDKVSGGLVRHNRGICRPGESDPEDIVSVYMSDDVLVTRNQFAGGGPSMTGSGILLGDQGGTNNEASYNDLVDTGQVGLGIAGGDDQRALYNRIVNSPQSYSNVGLYGINLGGTGGAIQALGNKVDWRQADGDYNPWYLDESGFTSANDWAADNDFGWRDYRP